MSDWLLVVIIAIVALGMIPLAPQILRLRIKVFRWMHWYRWADWFESHLRGLVFGLRVTLALIGVVLLFSAWQKWG